MNNGSRWPDNSIFFHVANEIFKHSTARAHSFIAWKKLRTMFSFRVPITGWSEAFDHRNAFDNAEQNGIELPAGEWNYFPLSWQDENVSRIFSRSTAELVKIFD